MAKAIGPTFSNELSAAGLLGLPFSWTADGTLKLDDVRLTADQVTTINAVYAAHDPTKLPPEQYRANAVAAGVQITSTSTPALNATYGLSAQDQINITGLQTSLLAGVTWIGYFRDVNRNKITMTAAQFTTIATKILEYMVEIDTAYETALAGGAWVAPTQPVVIA